jgi:hypothetical protein
MSNHPAGEPGDYRWVMLTVYVLMALGLWTCWFAQAPLLGRTAFVFARAGSRHSRSSHRPLG